MADTTTTNYSLTKPEVGASEDTWGTKLNTNLDTLDTTIKSVSDVANASLPKAGGTVTGDITTTANINLGDNDKVQLGAGNDLQITHDASGSDLGSAGSYIRDTGVGDLHIASSNNLYLDDVAFNPYIKCEDTGTGGIVTLYTEGSARLTTTTDGVDIGGTGALRLPNGTTAQQPTSPSAGDLRWNTDDTSAEIYDGSAWGSVGGGGAAETPYAEHSNNITSAYSIASGNNAVSGGPITVGTGGSVTVPTGSTWTIV